MAERILFLRAKSWVDNDGQGLPDWWQLNYFGQTGVDAWADLDGDGLSNIEEFYRGTNPNQFEPPPAPVPFNAQLDPSGTSVTLTWHAPPGTVSYYVLERSDAWPSTNYTQIATPSGTSFQDTGSFQTNFLMYDPYSYASDGSRYRIRAIYPGGSSQTAETLIDAGDQSLAVDAYLTPNETGRYELVCPFIPSKVTSLRLEWMGWDYWYVDGGPDYLPQILSITNLVGGKYVFPDSEITNHLYWGVGQVTSWGDYLWVRGIDASGRSGQPVNAGPVYQDNAPYFVDGRRHMKQNLEFQLRAPTRTNTITLTDASADGGGYPDFDLPKDTNYVESGFLHFSLQNKGAWAPPDLWWATFIRRDNLWPFYINQRFHASIYDTNSSDVAAAEASRAPFIGLLLHGLSTYPG
jgi:hypothetical protein